MREGVHCPMWEHGGGALNEDDIYHFGIFSQGGNHHNSFGTYTASFLTPLIRGGRTKQVSIQNVIIFSYHFWDHSQDNQFKEKSRREGVKREILSHGRPLQIITFCTREEGNLKYRGNRIFAMVLLSHLASYRRALLPRGKWIRQPDVASTGNGFG